jgi:hypothetical protein
VQQAAVVFLLGVTSDIIAVHLRSITLLWKFLDQTQQEEKWLNVSEKSNHNILPKESKSEQSLKERLFRVQHYTVNFNLQRSRST